MLVSGPPGAGKTTLAFRLGAALALHVLSRDALKSGLDFRHGAAVHQLRAGVPLSEAQQQLGHAHARIDTTTLYTKLTNRERRSYADRVEW